jgi:acylphosphatase
MMADLALFHATVHGRVHGVFFRASVQRRAGELNITGYVCNLPDGTVEVEAEGEREQLEKLLEYLRVGPRPARVDKVVTSWADYRGEFRNFDIRY